jgi:mono/diheme cytochrome c family protein
MTHHSSALAIVASIPLVLIASAGPAPQGATPDTQKVTKATTVQGHMDAHFARAREIQDAVVRGDLDGTKAPARWMADHQEVAGLPAGTETHVAAMKTAASSVASASDIRMAAQGAASLVASCGDCHTAAKVTPRMPDLGIVKVASGKQAHMAEHQHAVNMLYRGLVAPSDADWKKGAEALKGAPLGGEAMPEAKDAADAEVKVHQLASHAADAKDRGAKVAAYGEVIGSCASCHGLHGRVWGPGAPKTQ